jgi:uncharacterized membrane protein YjgN (DUF898 family)
VAAPAPPRPASVPAAVPAATPSPSVWPLKFHGTGGALFEIHLTNLFFTVLTLGVYRFWAKTNVRRYLMSQTELAGDRFAWHGTGLELLIGFVKALVVFGVPVAILNVIAVFEPDGLIGVIAQVLGPLIVLVFLPVAMVGVHRYRLSRTSWRGIRCSFHGRLRDFFVQFVIDAACIAVTLGLWFPVFQVRRYRFMTVHGRFGQLRFGFDGQTLALLGPFVVAVVLTLPTFGLVWFWYVARKRRYLVGHTTIEGLRGVGTVTGRELANLVIGNWLLLIFTFGLAWPWTRVRTARFNYERTRLEGAIDLDAVIQEPQDAAATGDALSSLLGTDMDFA